MPWTYIVECADHSYYVGSTWDLTARLWQHNHSDLGAAYTRHRRPVRLVWSAWYDRIEDAYAFEKQIQGWNRKKREALIRGDWDALPGLSRRSVVQRREAEQAAAEQAGASEPPTKDPPDLSRGAGQAKDR